MLDWKFVNEIWLYDGSFEGLLTIVFDSYISKKLPYKIIQENSYIFNLLDKTRIIKTDFSKSYRVFNGIYKNICNDALYNAYYAFLCSNLTHISSNKEIDIVRFLIHGFISGPKIMTMMSLDYVLNVFKLRKNTLSEAHKFKGLVRFQEIGNNLFYSSIHPENNIIENLGHFFIRRFPTHNLIIHDKTHSIAFLYNSKEYNIISVNNTVFNPSITEKEKQFQGLWKIFFKTIAISERKNEKCQMQFMPKKYWNDLIEKK